MEDKIEELRRQLESASHDYIRAQALVDTHKEMFGMGHDIHRAAIYRNNLRVRHYFQLVRRLENDLKFAEHRLGIKMAKEVSLIRQEMQRAALHDAQLAREHREEMARQHRESQEHRQNLLIKKLRALVGEEAFLAACKSLDDEPLEVAA